MHADGPAGAAETEGSRAGSAGSLQEGAEEGHGRATLVKECKSSSSMQLCSREGTCLQVACLPHPCMRGAPHGLPHTAPTQTHT